LDQLELVTSSNSVYLRCSQDVLVNIFDVIPEFYIPNDIIIPQTSCAIERVIATGLETEVHLGSIPSQNPAVQNDISSVANPSNAEQVAIKMLRWEFLKGESEFSVLRKNIFQEIQILLRSLHPHLVGLRGVLLRPFGIALEYMNGGSLYHYLQQCANKHRLSTGSISDLSVASLPSWKERVKIASDIACGMHFLHTQLFIHRDLKSPNVLLRCDEGCLTAKVSDFGTCASLEFADTFRISAVDNPRWLPPEILNDFPYTAKADVYAYGIACDRFHMQFFISYFSGIILWELLTASVPFSEFRFDWQIASAIVTGETPKLPVSLPFSPSYIPKYTQTLKSCCCFTPPSRPSFDSLAESFLSLLHEIDE
jgi:serine/threonine protein kinase